MLSMALTILLVNLTRPRAMAEEPNDSLPPFCFDKSNDV